MGAVTSELKHALVALSEAVETVERLLPRDPVRVESEDGVKIHPECVLVVDGLKQDDFVVREFGVEYADPGFIPGVPSLGLSCGPLPIVKVYVESRSFAATKGEIGGSDVTVEALGPGNPHRPAMWRGKKVSACTREELLQMATFLAQENVGLRDKAGEF